MLADPSDAERAVLGAIRYAPEHGLPASRSAPDAEAPRAWASWNFLRWPRQGEALNDVAVTYWMNALQGIDDSKPLFSASTRRSSPNPN